MADPSDVICCVFREAGEGMTSSGFTEYNLLLSKSDWEDIGLSLSLDSPA